jgi:hemin uptake protein HemP
MLDSRPARPLGSIPTARQDDTSTAIRPGMTRIDSRRLLDGGRELVIDHAGVEYRLRLTRNDKLILTK